MGMASDLLSLASSPLRQSAASTTSTSSPAITSERYFVLPSASSTYECTGPALILNGLGGTKPVCAVSACTKHSAFAEEPTKMPSPSRKSLMRSRHTRSARLDTESTAVTRAFTSTSSSPFVLVVEPSPSCFDFTACSCEFLALMAAFHMPDSGDLLPSSARSTSASTPNCNAPANPSIDSKDGTHTATRVPAARPAAIKFSAGTKTTPFVASSTTHATDPIAANASCCACSPAPEHQTPMGCPVASVRCLESSSYAKSCSACGLPLQHK
mmetsp:Transcript_73086/g.144941  ORF Transcript_73086/g.144941 Transcript_73086/m.144941 type:complete len:270 (-) Transcript_73086:369-1178(-)